MKNQTSQTSVSSQNLSHRAVQISSLAQASWKNIAAACTQKLHELKERLAAQFTSEYSSTVSAQVVRQAVQEAVSLAASTAYPAFVLPALAEEKVRSASLWRQQSLREPVLAFAA